MKTEGVNNINDTLEDIETLLEKQIPSKTKDQILKSPTWYLEMFLLFVKYII